MVKVNWNLHKLKYKDSGDPISFKNFLRTKKIDSKLLPRYVGIPFRVLLNWLVMFIFLRLI